MSSKINIYSSLDNFHSSIFCFYTPSHIGITVISTMLNMNPGCGLEKNQDLLAPTLQALEDARMEWEDQHWAILRAIDVLYRTVIIEISFRTPERLIDVEAKELEAAAHILRIETMMSRLKTGIDKITVDILIGLVRAAGEEQETTREWAENYFEVINDEYKRINDAFEGLEELFEVGKGNWGQVRMDLIECYGLEFLESEAAILDRLHGPN